MIIQYIGRGRVGKVTGSLTGSAFERRLKMSNPNIFPIKPYICMLLSLMQNEIKSPCDLNLSPLKQNREQKIRAPQAITSGKLLKCYRKL
jgi:hypothetical protein